MFPASVEVDTNCTSDDIFCSSSTTTIKNSGACTSILWYANFINEVTLDLLRTKYDIRTWNGPNLAKGCIGVVLSGAAAASTTSSMASPTPTSLAAMLTPNGYPLQDNAVQNGDFDNVLYGWSLLTILEWSQVGVLVTTRQQHRLQIHCAFSLDSVYTTQWIDIFRYLIAQNDGSTGNSYGVSTTVSLCT